MKIAEPHLFWEKLQNGQMSWLAYEKMWRYVRSSQVQLDRIYSLWNQSSQITINPNDPDAEELFKIKKLNMEQVISDIHFLVMCLDKVWKLADRLTRNSLCPELNKSRKFKSTLKSFLKPYLDARDTFEHYDEQVIGGDPKKKGPGSQKISLKANVGFSFGERPPIEIGQNFNQEFIKLLNTFDSYIYEDISAVTKTA